MFSHTAQIQSWLSSCSAVRRSVAAGGPVSVTWPTLSGINVWMNTGNIWPYRAKTAFVEGGPTADLYSCSAEIRRQVTFGQVVHVNFT